MTKTVPARASGAPGATGARAGAVAGSKPPTRRGFHRTVLVAGAAFGITAPFTALLVVALGGSQTAAALVVSSMGVSLLLIDIFAGRAIPRLGSRWILCAAPLLFGAGSLISVVSVHWELVGIGRVIQGLGTALFMGGGVHLAVRVAGAGRTASGSAIGRFNAAWFAGIAVGPIGGGLIASLLPGTDGLRLLFGVAAGLTVAAAILGWYVAPRVPSSGRVVFGPPRGVRLPGWRMVATLVVVGVGQAVRAGLAMTLVPMAGLSAQLSTLAIGGALFLLALADVAAMVWGTQWADRHGRRPLLLIGLMAGAVLTVVLTFGLHRPLIVTLVALGLGVTVGITWTLPAAMTVDLMPDPEDAIVVYRIASDIGMLAGGIGVASVLAIGGLQPTLLAFAAVLVASFVLVLVIGETRGVAGRPAAALIAPAEPAL